MLSAVAGGVFAVTTLVIAPDLPWATDFRSEVWEAGRALLQGRDPLRHDGAHGTVYPPASTVLTAPFALLPYPAAVALGVVVLLAAVTAALWLCGVTDWRCLAVALASPPIVAGLTYANLSLALLFAVAMVWRWRASALVAGVALGLAIAVKIFLWPLLVWLLLIRQVRSAIAASMVAIAATLAGFGIVGFHLIDDFVTVTRANVDLYYDSSASLAAAGAAVGVPLGTATALSAIAALMLIAVAARGRDNEVACLTLCLAAALVATPITWGHYYALFFVPLAITSPRLSWSWAYPYVTAPQLSTSFSMLGRLLDCLSGFALAALVFLKTDRSALRQDPERPRRATLRAQAGCTPGVDPPPRVPPARSRRRWSSRRRSGGRSARRRRRDRGRSAPRRHGRGR